VPRRAEWAWRFVTEGTREKGRKKSAIMDRPGILELRAVLPKEDSLGECRVIEHLEAQNLMKVMQSNPPLRLLLRLQSSTCGGSTHQPA
jgi:hypothetical protein